MSSAFWQIRARAEIAFDHPWAWMTASAAALVLVALLAATQGAVDLSIPELVRSLVNEQDSFHSVLWNVRFPRLACAAIVGMNLAIAGTLLQTTVRNPLADPGILGVSAGAGVGALIVILFFPGHSTWVPWAAFVGGMLSILTLLGLAWSRALGASTLRIVLSGVALQAILFAAIALMSFAFADRAPSFTAFMVGSLNGLGWNETKLLILPTLIGVVASILTIRTLNLLLLDDGAASGLGVPVQAARFAAACIAALLTAAAVSVAGLVGFVGLVVPNGMRLLVGPDHRALLPVSALGGAALVILADTAARISLAPLELPVGALLSLIGGPYFLYLLWKKLP
jgi:iron complex transport system permease protein